MGFTEAVRTVLVQKYATFSGRASRSEFWWFQLFFCIVAGAGGFVAGFMGAFSNRQGGSATVNTAFLIIGGLLILAIFLPLIALEVRRFHDRNISGWWYLALSILGLIPYVGYVTGLVIFVINLLPGTEGPNKFGADPLRPEIRAEVFA
ncbi:DUF805 domain-containing protein [Rhizobium esperanzae]|nr:DUF805 domain-containing protein [Rhizobium esperanzae]